VVGNTSSAHVDVIYRNVARVKLMVRHLDRHKAHNCRKYLEPPPSLFSLYYRTYLLKYVHGSPYVATTYDAKKPPFIDVTAVPHLPECSITPSDCSILINLRS